MIFFQLSKIGTRFKITTFSWNTLPEICKFIFLLNASSFDTCRLVLKIKKNFLCHFHSTFSCHMSPDFDISFSFRSNASLPSLDMSFAFFNLVNNYLYLNTYLTHFFFTASLLSLHFNYSLTSYYTTNVLPFSNMLICKMYKNLAKRHFIPSEWFLLTERKLLH